MKELLTEWRKFVNETKWEDLDVPKGKWVQVSKDDIESSREPGNVDLTDEIYSLIHNAYKDIGGNFSFKSSEDVPGKSDIWMAVDMDDDDEPDALRVAKTKPSGKKLTASGHDGTRSAKAAYKDKTADMLKTPGYYAEMSKAIAHIMMTKYDVPSVEDPEKVRKILGKDITWLGAHPEGKYPDRNGWYTREIGGKKGILKIMLGNPR